MDEKIIKISDLEKIFEIENPDIKNATIISDNNSSQLIINKQITFSNCVFTFVNSTDINMNKFINFEFYVDNTNKVKKTIGLTFNDCTFKCFMSFYGITNENIISNLTIRNANFEQYEELFDNISKFLMDSVIQLNGNFGNVFIEQKGTKNNCQLLINAFKLDGLTIKGNYKTIQTTPRLEVNFFNLCKIDTMIIDSSLDF